jgi:ABC-type Fe3+/spermidine/putrescine transport system ATPase subunit
MADGLERIEMSEVLRITDVGQTFNGTAVLSGINLTMKPGERLAVIGSSGSGKTTLLRLIAGLESPSKGEIFIAGKPVSRAGELLIAPEHREVAMVFQGLALFPHLRALDQIAFAARGRGGIEHAKSLLNQIGLGHRGSARLDELSGGERQRIALARAIAQNPKLILMDEPFSSLDDEKRGEMRNLLRQLLETCETTLILVTHSRDDALDLARRTLVLDRGRPVAEDSIESILLHPQHQAAVRAFGLGQVVDGEFTSDGKLATAFGNLEVNGPRTTTGRCSVLIRPAQPRVVAEGDGVEVKVVGVELRPPETNEIHAVAVVQMAGSTLRVFLRGHNVAAGDRVTLTVDGPCEPVSLRAMTVNSRKAGS